MEQWPKWLEEGGEEAVQHLLNTTDFQIEPGNLGNSLPSTAFATGAPPTPFVPFNLPYATPVPSTPQPQPTPQYFTHQGMVLENPKEEFSSPQIKEEDLMRQQLLQQQILLQQQQQQQILQQRQQQLQQQQQTPTNQQMPGAPSSQVQNLLEQIWAHHRNQNQELSDIRNLQKRMVSEPEMGKALFDHLRGIHQQLKNKLDAELNVMEEIFNSSILSLNQLVRWQTLLTQLKVQVKQLELYQKELLQLTDPSITQPAVALVITDQPPTCTFFKEKPTPEAFCIQLLTGALTEVTSVNKVKATVICESNQWRPRGAAKVMAEDTKGMDLQQQTVQFQPKFLVGTRKFVVNLAFSVRVRAVGPMQGNLATEGEYSIESDISNPFVVITNESQWAEAEGTLIKKEVFGARTEVPWPYFANIFHLHFIHATRQDVTRPARTLQYSEITYVHEKWFQAKGAVSIKEFDTFWTRWFGKNIHQIRYQRNIGNMWKCGLIYGLMGKEEIERALADERPGSFIIRFSENHSGLFAIAYKHVEGVKHYLVRPDDLSTKKGLADFVNEHPIFVYLLRIATNNEGNPHLIAESKDAVLSPYLSDRPNIADPGYDKLPGQL